MDKYSEIKKLIREIIGNNANTPFKVTVKSIEGDTCTVTLKGGLDISEVKLKATSKEGDSLLLVPKVNTEVLVLSLSGSVDNLTVIRINEVEKIDYKQNGLEVLIDSTDKKVSIKNDSVSLVDVLSDLATLLKGFKVFTPSGPSGVPLPDTITKIVEFETKFKQILK